VLRWWLAGSIAAVARGCKRDCEPRSRVACSRSRAYRLSVDYKDRIVIDPTIRFGKPSVRGTRIAVGDVLSYLASGMSEEEIIADFPQLTGEDIRACLAFAAERERRVVNLPAG
jgi:uncharacterized protein (DUF433 family)